MVSKVIQFEIGDILDAEKILGEYADKIYLINRDPTKWARLPKYCILIFLENPEELEISFQINKKGFGVSCAWISIKDINLIKKEPQELR